jgi:DNA polymerase
MEEAVRPLNNEEYKKLVDEIARCTKCPLHKFRKRPVPGDGPLDADVMIIGEAPGRYEDEAGKPFVGPAGKLLDYLLSLANLNRKDVYITNVVKCRPPKNRDPKPEEISACLPYLLRQVKIIRPKVIIALGRISGSTLFSLIGKKWRGMSAEHGVPVRGVIEGVEVVIVPTYHPAAALYKPDIKKILENDFKIVIKEVIHESRKRSRRTLMDYF